MVALVLILDGL